MAGYKTEGEHEGYNKLVTKFNRYKEKLDSEDNPESLREDAAEIDRLYLKSVKGMRQHSRWWNNLHDLVGTIYRMPAKKRMKSGLVGKVAGIAAIASFSLSFLFFSPATTGFAIASLNENTTSAIAVIFFIVGIIASFLYFRKREK